jgi:hypothetical protein
MEKRNPVLKVLAYLIGSVLLYVAIQNLYVASRNKSHLDASLVEIADEVNKNAPAMVSAETRFDKGVPSSGKITFYFSMPTVAKEELDLRTVRTNMRQMVIAHYRTNSAMAIARDLNAVLSYQYRDKNGDLFFETTVSPKDF